MIIRVSAENLVDLVFQYQHPAPITVWVDGVAKEITMPTLDGLLRGTHEHLTRPDQLGIFPSYFITLYPPYIVEQFPEPLRSFSTLDFWKKCLDEHYALALFWCGYNPVRGILLHALPKIIEFKRHTQEEV